MVIYISLKASSKLQTDAPPFHVANERHYNFHGFYGARLSVDQSVRNFEPKTRTRLFTIVAFFLFNAPHDYITKIEKLWIDETIKSRLWKVLKSKLEDGWQRFVLYVCAI